MERLWIICRGCVLLSHLPCDIHSIARLGPIPGPQNIAPCVRQKAMWKSDSQLSFLLFWNDPRFLYIFLSFSYTCYISDILYNIARFKSFDARCHKLNYANRLCALKTSLSCDAICHKYNIPLNFSTTQSYRKVDSPLVFLPITTKKKKKIQRQLKSGIWYRYLSMEHCWAVNHPRIKQMKTGCA